MEIILVKQMDRIPQIAAALRPMASAAVKKTTFAISTRAKMSMQPPKSGRLYLRPGGKMHQSSAPGEAPAIDLGNLVNSIQVEFLGDLTGVVFTQTEYAAILELGGGAGSIAARPFFSPAAEAEWDNLLSAMQQVLG